MRTSNDPVTIHPLGEAGFPDAWSAGALVGHQRQPDAVRRAGAVGLLSDYLHHRLTGRESSGGADQSELGFSR